MFFSKQACYITVIRRSFLANGYWIIEENVYEKENHYDFTAIMYIGEQILLHGNLYRFGTGFFFDELFFLAPVDFLIIFLSGAITALILLPIAPGRITIK